MEKSAPVVPTTNDSAVAPNSELPTHPLGFRPDSVFIANRRGVEMQWASFAWEGDRDPSAEFELSINTHPDGYAVFAFKRYYIMTKGGRDLADEFTGNLPLSELRQLAHMFQVAVDRMGELREDERFEEYPLAGDEA
jgi:hypothetical protein